MKTRDELTAMLNDLEGKLPEMISTSEDPGDFWMAFAGQADLIEDQAGDHGGMVNQRIQAMLAAHGRYIAVIEEE